MCVNTFPAEGEIVGRLMKWFNKLFPTLDGTFSTLNISWSSWTKEWFSCCLEGWNKYSTIEQTKPKQMTSYLVLQIFSVFVTCLSSLPTGQSWMTNQADRISFKFSHKTFSVPSAQMPQIPSRTDYEPHAPEVWKRWSKCNGNIMMCKKCALIVH